MIVEHSMVTTLGPGQAFDLVEGFLGAYGFKRLGDPGAVQRTFARGKKDGSAAAYFKDVPLKVRVDFDRGRLNFAASIDFRSKEDARLRDFTVGLAIGLDRLLEDRLDIAMAHAMVESHADAVRKHDKRLKIIRVSLVSLLIAIIALPVLLGIILNMK
jgi:hypothetical protein